MEWNENASIWSPDVWSTDEWVKLTLCTDDVNTVLHDRRLVNNSEQREREREDDQQFASSFCWKKLSKSHTLADLAYEKRSTSRSNEKAIYLHVHCRILRGIIYRTCTHAIHAHVTITEVDLLRYFCVMEFITWACCLPRFSLRTRYSPHFALYNSQRFQWEKSWIDTRPIWRVRTIMEDRSEVKTRTWRFSD